MATEPRSAKEKRRTTLPDDDEALAALADAAFGPPGRSRSLAAVPTVQQPAAGQGAATLASDPAAAQPAAAAAAGLSVTAPDPASAVDDEPTGGTADWIKQSTVQVDAGVAQRFKRYKSRQPDNPSNAEVVFRAVDAARGRERAIIDARRPQLPEGRRLGRAVPGRRPAGTRLPTQINFRPTVAEEAEIKRLAREAGADSMSAFVNAMLDDYLPR